MTRVTPFTGFRPATLTFLRGLRRNNRRDWFEARRETYQRELVDPMRALVEELDVRFARLAPEYIGDPRRSLFRIYRDVRFSKDKSPYKAHAALWIYHRAPGRGVGKEIDGGAGFYLHVEPGGSLVAGGLWMPPRPSLAKVRKRLEEDLEGWERIVQARGFKRRFGTLNEDDDGVLLKRLPRGYAEGHPADRWLRYNSFTVHRYYSDTDILAPDLADGAMKDFAAMVPMCRWLNQALGYLPATKR